MVDRKDRNVDPMNKNRIMTSSNARIVDECSIYYPQCTDKSGTAASLWRVVVSGGTTQPYKNRLLVDLRSSTLMPFDFW